MLQINFGWLNIFILILDHFSTVQKQVCLGESLY